jgi:hypothetical protein
MLTGRLAAHSLLYGAHHDLWDLQPDEYLEASCPDADAREGGRT